MVRSNMVDPKIQQDMKLTHDNILQSLATSLSSTLSQAAAPDFNLAAVATSLANFQVFIFIFYLVHIVFWGRFEELNDKFCTVFISGRYRTQWTDPQITLHKLVLTNSKPNNHNLTSGQPLADTRSSDNDDPRTSTPPSTHNRTLSTSSHLHPSSLSPSLPVLLPSSVSYPQCGHHQQHAPPAYTSTWWVPTNNVLRAAQPQFKRPHHLKLIE